MRINDLSTFDSKPILLSQFTELLNSNNITMQGNQVNVSSGLVLLDDKGKIPEDADIQRIFYIDGEFPTENLVKNALYVSSNGEARATGENAEYINISLQVVSDFSAVSDDTVATSKAIKEYVDSAVASASGEQHIFYVNSLPEVVDAVENSLYVIKNTKEAQIFDGTEYVSISLETLNDFSTVSNDTLATTQAISAFVDEKISNINIPDPDLSAYQPVSSMTDYALKTEIPNISGKVDNVGTNQSINDNATFTINATTSFDVNAPFSSFAGGKVVCYDGLGVTGDITLNGNTFNMSGGLVVVGDDGKIPSGLYDKGDVQHIFYVDDFPEPGVANSLYVKKSTKESKIYTGTEYVSISLETVTNFDTVDDNTLATSKAIKDFVETKVADIQLPSGVLSLEIIEDFPSSGTNDTLYIDKNNQVKVYADNDWKDISLEVVENLNSPNQTTVPTTQAVKAYVDANTAAPTYTKVIINQSDFSNDDSTYTLNGETGGKYYELNGICDVTVTNADGYVIGLDVRYMFDTTKTRLYIPNSLAAGTITNWTIVYLVKTIA